MSTVFTELANIVVVIVTNPMFILPWVHEKFTVKFTMSNVDGCAIYMHIGCLNCPEKGAIVVLSATVLVSTFPIQLNLVLLSRTQFTSSVIGCYSLCFCTCS